MIDLGAQILVCRSCWVFLLQSIFEVAGRAQRALGESEGHTCFSVFDRRGEFFFTPQFEVNGDRGSTISSDNHQEKLCFGLCHRVQAWETVADNPMRTLMVAVALNTGEFSLQNPRIPKRHMIKVLRQFPCDT